MKDSIRVKTDKSRDDYESTRGRIDYKLRKTDYSFEISNSSKTTIEDLTLKYWILVERDNGGDEKVEVLQKEK